MNIVGVATKVKSINKMDKIKEEKKRKVNNIIVCEILVPKIQKKDKIPLNH
jgi:hypothetical protein